MNLLELCLFINLNILLHNYSLEFIRKKYKKKNLILTVVSYYFLFEFFFCKVKKTL